MNIKELKRIIQDLPDDMPVGLLDVTTDDFEDCNHALLAGDFCVDDYYSVDGDGEPLGKMLFIRFYNPFNDDPILSCESWEHERA